MFTGESKARPYIQLFKWDGERYVEPKIQTYHLGKADQFRLFRARSTTSAHKACVALPRTKACAAVLYTSDLTAYSNMYLVEVGEFDELPDLE